MKASNITCLHLYYTALFAIKKALLLFKIKIMLCTMRIREREVNSVKKELHTSICDAAKRHNGRII